ncbi:MAG: hypothetical protein KGS61_14130 [Verrucomicrobia bacterium]|nr:hypothetical protein [Verrucomicrobiota bacterium]
MNTNPALKPSRVAVLAGLALACAATLTRAQTPDYIIDRFDDPTEADSWARWWGSALQTYEYDGTVNTGTNAGSGSLKATIQFDLASYGSDNQFAAVRYFTAADGSRETLDGSQYTNLVFDLKFDTNSPSSGGNFGYFEYGVVPTDYSQIELGHLSVASTNGDWTHIVAPIDPSTAKITNIFGFWIKIWSGDPSSGMTGTTTFWVDNVELIGITNTVIPSPTMGLSRATPGLQLIASAPAQTYQRQSISTLSTDTNGNPTAYSWVGGSSPVTYSVTIASYPSTNYSGFQTHIFLVPMASLPTYESSPDWNEPNVVFLQIANNADGSASATFRYKTNLPNGNTMLWNSNPTNGPVGALASITDPSPLGTWSLTFQNNTNVTLTAPSGASTNFVMPPDSAALFADPLVAVFGAQPNGDANIGQTVILSRIQVTGTTSAIDEKFIGATLDTTTWQIVAQDAAGVTVAPPDSLYWINWSLPATGFLLEASTNLSSTSAWADAGLTNVVQVLGKRMVVLTSSSLPGTNGFYRVSKP